MEVNFSLAWSKVYKFRARLSPLEYSWTQAEVICTIFRMWLPKYFLWWQLQPLGKGKGHRGAHMHVLVGQTGRTHPLVHSHSIGRSCYLSPSPERGLELKRLSAEQRFRRQERQGAGARAGRKVLDQSCRHWGELRGLGYRIHGIQPFHGNGHWGESQKAGEFEDTPVINGIAVVEKKDHWTQKQKSRGLNPDLATNQSFDLGQISLPPQAQVSV